MGNPKYPNVVTEETALQHIINHPWFVKLDQTVADSSVNDIRLLLADKYQIAVKRLEDGTWRNEFAGKEVLRQIGTMIVDWTNTSKMRKAEFESDLAKEIADWQVKNKAIPQDLLELRSELRQRISRPPRSGV